MARKKLDKLSDMNLSLEQVTEVVENEMMWKKFEEVTRMAERKEEVSGKDLKFAMGAVYLTLQFTNYSRPGAISNCTVDNYLERETVDGKQVIAVAEHKTGEKGTAKLVMDSVLAERIHRYFALIRPLLVSPGHDINRLFILSGSKPVERAGNLMSFLEGILKITIPSPTLVRKIGCTAVAKSCSEAEHRIVSRQMCHDPLVGAKYYEAVRGKKDAVEAVNLLQDLRKKSTPTAATPQSESSEEETFVPPKRWTLAETQLVGRHFKSNVEQRTTPSMDDCIPLLARLRGRDTKQIQDKVRTLIRQELRKAARQQVPEKPS